MVNGSPFTKEQWRLVRKLVDKEVNRLKHSQDYVGTLPETSMTPQVVIDERKRQIEKQRKELVKLQAIQDVITEELLPKCVDCGKESANPGLDCCGTCYNKRIRGY